MWLYLTDENLHLMEGDEYEQKLPVKKLEGKKVKVENIPQEWFSEKRDLIVNFDGIEPRPKR